MNPFAFYVGKTITLPSSGFESTDGCGYHCHLAIIRDEEGVYSALILNLPGVGSCGDTEKEAIMNAIEAIQGAVASFSGQTIPWKEPGGYCVPEGAAQKWILVGCE